MSDDFKGFLSHISYIIYISEGQVTMHDLVNWLDFLLFKNEYKNSYLSVFLQHLNVSEFNKLLF